MMINSLVSTILIIGIYFLQASYSHQHYNPNYVASTCGNIQNISNPFRLRGDSEDCGDPNYELVCENNTTTILNLYSQRYIVRSINYNNYTIRLSDASISNDTCSFPQYSRYEYIENSINYQEYPYGIQEYNCINSEDHTVYIVVPATLMSCPHPQHHSFYINATSCVGGDEYIKFSTARYAYIRAGYLHASEVGEMCSIHAIIMISTSSLSDYDDITLPEFHNSLLYGFELSWFSGLCGGKCTGEESCQLLNGTTASCIDSSDYYSCDGPITFILTSLSVDGPSNNDVGQLLIGIAGGIAENLIILVPPGPLGPRVLIGMPIMFGLLICKYRRRHLSAFDAIEGFLQDKNKLGPIRYSYSDIKKMTKGLKQKLGQGGFGSVYKGKLRSGRDVAVKLLKNKAEGSGQDFINEVGTIGRIHHVNVVKLVGYSAELSKRALVYDFMPNGSLEKYILGKDKMDILDWSKKYNIAIGVARGIEYLHRGCDIQILHFDIKPHNILLDEDFTPKICDFGLAKFYPTDHNTVNLTAIRGTIGYVAPELINRGIGNVSYKADVYSFGMLLMEMVGLNRDLEENSKDSSMYFPYWIYNHLDQRKDIEIGNVHEVSSSEVGVDDDEDEKTTRKMTIVALWCIQMSPGDRPSMKKVLEMLEGDVRSLQVPLQPSYSPQIPDRISETYTTDSSALLSYNASRHL